MARDKHPLERGGYSQKESLLQQGAHFVHHISTPTATLQLNLQVLERYLPLLVQHYRATSQDSAAAIPEELLLALQNLGQPMQQSLSVIQQRTREFTDQLQQYKATGPAQTAATVAAVKHRLVRSILLVEDEEIHQQVALHQLDGRCQVELASNGQQAIEKCQNRHFDLVLMDFLLPGMGGGRVLQALAAIEAEPPLVISFSNLPQGAEEFANAAIPVAAHLSKPFKLANLEAVLADLGGALAEEIQS